jgi:hypothetical protein
MRPLPTILLLAGGLAVGVLIGRVWGQSARTFESERVIGKEITLLERAKSAPTCERLRVASSGSGEERVDELRVLWRRVPATKQIQRLVVSPQLDFAYEEVTVPCAP